MKTNQNSLVRTVLILSTGKGWFVEYTDREKGCHHLAAQFNKETPLAEVLAYIATKPNLVLHQPFARVSSVDSDYIHLSNSTKNPSLWNVTVQDRDSMEWNPRASVNLNYEQAMEKVRTLSGVMVS